MQPNPAPDNPLNNKDSGDKIVVTCKKRLQTIRTDPLVTVKPDVLLRATLQTSAATFSNLIDSLLGAICKRRETNLFASMCKFVCVDSSADCS